MKQRSHVPASARLLSVVTLAALAACGGSGSDGTPATVSTMSVVATRYGTPALVTVDGTHLSNLSLTAPGCKKVTRLTSAPTASTETTAYFSCTPSGAYVSTIDAVTNGTTVGTQSLTVSPPIVKMTVSGGVGGSVSGTIEFDLRGDKAPITVDNFLAYVNAGFYTNTIFHRIVAGFVVQGGGFGPTTSGTLPAAKTTLYSPIALELGGGSNLQWTAAMARTADDNSATSQFFFNLVDNSGVLDKSSGTDGYAVFADVTSSAAVIQAIAAATPCPLVLSAGLPLGDGSCVPVPNVTIVSATQTQ